MAWVQPVYDRTLADVTNKTAKGFFNVVDWIRINGDTEFVAALVTALRCVSVNLNDLDVPTTASFPSAEDINDFVENIEMLRTTIGLSTSDDLVTLDHNYRTGGSADAPDYADVNAWEKNLLTLKRFLVNTAYYSPSCGVLGSGQTRIWQVRFRLPFMRDVTPTIRRPRMGLAVAGSGLNRQNGFRRYGA